MSDLTSLPDHEELIVALVLIFVVVRYVIHFQGLTRVSCLHASASWIIQIQSEFNAHPEVGYVIRIPIRVKRCAYSHEVFNNEKNPRWLLELLTERRLVLLQHTNFLSLSRYSASSK